MLLLFISNCIHFPRIEWPILDIRARTFIYFTLCIYVHEKTLYYIPIYVTYTYTNIYKFVLYKKKIRVQKSLYKNLQTIYSQYMRIWHWFAVWNGRIILVVVHTHVYSLYRLNLFKSMCIWNELQSKLFV